MIPSSLYCSACGAENATDRSMCFACNQPLHIAVSDNATLLQGRYRILTQVGKGGFGAVYRAEDTQKHGASVAVKQINLRGLTPQETIEATDAFNREVSLLSNLSHPNLPHIYDNFTDPEHWYLVMDFIEGETLETYLDTKGANYTASLDEVFTLGIQLCTVLNYLHTCEPVIIFRDLKPANIMRTPTGKLYLIDFGIARSFKPGKLKDTIPFGSPGYAAPEQYGKAQTTPRADIYSLGALLHMLLTGDDPVDNPFRFAPLRIYGVPGLTDLDTLISRMIQIDANKRPATIMEVKDELQRIADMQGSPRLWHPPVGQTPPALDVIGSGQQQISISGSGQQQLYMPLAQRKQASRRKFLVGGFAVTGLTIIGAGGIANIVSALQGSTNTGPEPGEAPPFNNGSLFGAIYPYMGHTQPVQDVVWSQDNNVLASVSDDGTVQVWVKDRAIVGDASTSNNPYIFDTIEKATCLAWGKGANEKLLAYNSGLTITIVEPPNYIPEILAPASDEVSSGINTFAWSPDGGFIVFSTSAGVQIWDIAQGKVVKHIDFLTNQAHTKESITSLSWSSDGNYIAAGVASKNQTVILDVSQVKVHATLADVGGRCVAWSPDSICLATVNDNKVSVSFVSGDYYDSAHYPLLNTVMALSWSFDSKYLVAASQDLNANIHVWSPYKDSIGTAPTTPGRPILNDVSPFTTHVDTHGNDIHSLAWSPDEKYIAIGADKAYLLEINPAMLTDQGQQGR